MLNFNVSPYYDDFDETKNFHRVLFKPGNAVQARELTQSQTILQNQVTKFANHVFSENTPVSGGKMSINFKCYYVKLQETYNGVAIDVNEFENLLVKSQNGTVLAKVVAVAQSTGGDPPTLILSYLSAPRFTDNDVIYVIGSNLACQAITSNSTGQSCTAHITQGVFYVLGNFVSNPEDTVILSKYSITPSVRVGLEINETIVDYVDEPSLLDPAVGATNYQAPGADRYKIGLSLQTRPLSFGDDQNFIELMRVENGIVAKQIENTSYSRLDDYFAQRTYETNGDFVLRNFNLTPQANTSNTDIYNMVVGRGVAYVHGYRLENQSSLVIKSNRARTTKSEQNNPVYMDYGNYLYINSLRGANNSVLDVAAYQPIDLHCVPIADINTTNTSTYGATVVSSGYIRNLEYDDFGTSSDANTYVYKAFVYDLQNGTPTANAVAGSSNTITLPGTYSTVSNAYYGVTISITNGTSAGDFRRIVSYNGTTRVATVDTPWTYTPTTNSVFALNFAIKDAETMVSSNSTLHILSTAVLDAQGRVNNTATGDPELQNPNVQEMLFRIGMPYVATLTDTSFTTRQIFRAVTFTSSGGNLVAQLPFGGDYSNVMKHIGTPSSTLSTSTVRENFIVIVTNKGSSNYNVGDLLPWTINSRTVSLNSDASIATLTGTSADLGGTFTATVIAKAAVTNGNNTGHILKRKNLIKANTSAVITSNTAVGSSTYTFVDDAALTSKGQVYIQNAGIVSAGQKQSLYLSDVKRIVKIVDTLNSANVPTVDMLTNPAYDVTSNFIFNNGQKDSYYDHASITLRVGAPKVRGNMLVLCDYYQHTGGDGYFSVDSYLNSSLPEDYREIGSYTSSSGNSYSLRDVLDFRPTRQNATYNFEFRYSNSGDTQRYGTLLPLDLSQFTGDYSYYLGRKDKLVLTKDKLFQILEGAPSVSPIFPTEPNGSLLLANIVHNPYTGYLPTEVVSGSSSDLKITKVKHKRYTMKDIGVLEKRIENLQYYTSLNLAEQKAQSLQVSDSLGLNRFKNGILVDNFSTFLASDTLSSDFKCNINTNKQQLSAMQYVKRFPLLALDEVLTYNTFGGVTEYTADQYGLYNIFSLPYTTERAAGQVIASRPFNLNSFSIVNRTITIAASPANINPVGGGVRVDVPTPRVPVVATQPKANATSNVVVAASANENVFFTPNPIEVNKALTIIVRNAQPGSNVRYKISSSSSYGSWIPLNQLDGPGTHRQVLPTDTFRDPGIYTFDFEFASGNTRQASVTVNAAGIVWTGGGVDLTSTTVVAGTVNLIDWRGLTVGTGTTTTTTTTTTTETTETVTDGTDTDGTTVVDPFNPGSDGLVAYDETTCYFDTGTVIICGDGGLTGCDLTTNLDRLDTALLEFTTIGVLDPNFVDATGQALDTILGLSLVADLGDGNGYTLLGTCLNFDGSEVTCDAVTETRLLEDIDNLVNGEIYAASINQNGDINILGTNSIDVDNINQVSGQLTSVSLENNLTELTVTTGGLVDVVNSVGQTMTIFDQSTGEVSAVITITGFDETTGSVTGTVVSGNQADVSNGSLFNIHQSDAQATNTTTDGTGGLAGLAIIPENTVSGSTVTCFATDAEGLSGGGSNIYNGSYSEHSLTQSDPSVGNDGTSNQVAGFQDFGVYDSIDGSLSYNVSFGGAGGSFSFDYSS